jgi:hypothetical protein
MPGNVGLQDLTLFAFCKNVIRANQAVLERSLSLSVSNN